MSRPPKRVYVVLSELNVPLGTFVYLSSAMELIRSKGAGKTRLAEYMLERTKPRKVYVIWYRSLYPRNLLGERRRWAPLDRLYTNLANAKRRVNSLERHQNECEIYVYYPNNMMYKSK